MPLMFQKFIFRDDVQSNKDAFYLFGDNVHRRGLGGQAKEMRGEPNAIGIATKWRGGMNDSDFFCDDDWIQATNIIRDDLRPVKEALADGKIVVMPLDGLGTGLSQLPRRAPMINDYLVKQLALLLEIRPLRYAGLAMDLAMLEGRPL